MKALRGIPASPGTVTGEAFVVTEGFPSTSLPPYACVVVARYSRPDLILLVAERVIAFVLDTGGATCHIASAARELGIPSVIGTEKGTSLIRPGAVVTVNGTEGVVTWEE